MTRSEAMAFAISTGKAIRHKYFGKGEFVHYVGNKLFDEDGNELSINEFWNIRSGGYWENDWKIMMSRIVIHVSKGFYKRSM